MKNWLSLIDYSTLYGVSVSTLRRRIREQSIPFEVREGKYFIEEVNIEKAARGRKQIQIPTGSLEGKDFIESDNSHMTQILIDELKKAYAQILTDKEDQIEMLKEEISDLRTLVRVLESELDRTKSLFQKESYEEAL